MEQHSAGNVYKAPEVILIVGNSMRRFHTSVYLGDMLRVLGHHVDIFTTSLNYAEATTKERYVKHFTPHDYRAFRTAYESVEGARSEKAYIIIESSLEDLHQFNITKHNVKTILCSDMRVSTKEKAQELREFIDGEYHHSHILDRLIYNVNTVPKEVFADQYFFLQIDEIAIPRQYTYGSGKLATCGFEIGEEVTIVHDAKRFVFPRPAILNSHIKMESVIGAIAYVLEEGYDIQHVLNGLDRLPVLPLFDEVKAEGNLLWTRPILLGDAIWDVLQTETSLCMGASIYLYHEDLIERSIDSLAQVLVVAEQEAESELYSEYFLKKERQSDHKIIYSSSREFLPHIPSTLFNSKKIMYMFEYMETFNNIVSM